MTHPDPERDDADVKRLFDDSANEPTGPMLTRMAARSRDIPSATRRPLLRWLWAPALAVAAAVAVLYGSPGGGDAPFAGPAPHPGPTAIATKTLHEPIEPPPKQTAQNDPEVDDLENDEVMANAAASWGGDSLYGADYGLDVLYDPADDTEADAWLAAADEILAEDG